MRGEKRVAISNIVLAGSENVMQQHEQLGLHGIPPKKYMLI